MCTRITWQAPPSRKRKFATERPATPKRRKHRSWLLAAALHCRSSAAGTAASAAATTAAVIAAVNAATAIAIITAITIGTGATSTAAVTHHRYHRRCPRHHCRSRQHRRIRRSSSLRDSTAIAVVSTATAARLCRPSCHWELLRPARAVAVTCAARLVWGGPHVASEPRPRVARGEPPLQLEPCACAQAQSSRNMQHAYLF